MMGYTGKNRPTGNKLSAKRVAELERVAAALELRKRGKNFQEIADICGWANRNGAYLSIQRHLAAAIREPAEELIELEVQRLDALLDGIWDSAAGTPSFTTTEPMWLDGSLIPTGVKVSARSGDEKAVGAALKIMERRSKLLGLDKPQEKKVDYTITEIPAAPPDMLDYNAKLIAALQIAGAINLELPAHSEYLNQPGLIMEASYAEDNLATAEDEPPQGETTGSTVLPK